MLKLLICIVLSISFSAYAEERIGLATYYATKSCQKEGTSGVFTANGERFHESELTCAMRSRQWGTRIKVINLNNNKEIVVRLNDFGPGHKPTTRGVIIDLTPAGWKALGLKTLDQKNGRGEVKVKVEILKD